MKRMVLAVIAGFIAWTLIVSLINRGLRLALPGYTEAEPALAFTLPMMFARLAMAAVTSVATGAIIRAVAPASRAAPWIVGSATTLMFIPVHIGMWSQFPVWYHLSFLLPLAPLVLLGAHLRGAGRGAARG